MFPFLSLPVELQVESLLHCDERQLRLLKRTCRSIETLIDHAAFDKLLFRTKSVDLAALERARQQVKVHLATFRDMHKLSQNEEDDLATDAFYKEHVNSGGLSRHPLLTVPFSFGEPYEELRVLSPSCIYCLTKLKPCSNCIAAKPERGDEDFAGWPHLKDLAASKENATEPPVSEIILRDTDEVENCYPYLPKMLVVKNSKVISMSSRKPRFEIKNEDNKPITVAQFWQSYCAYAAIIFNRFRGKRRFQGSRIARILHTQGELRAGGSYLIRKNKDDAEDELENHEGRNCDCCSDCGETCSECEDDGSSHSGSEDDESSHGESELVPYVDETWQSAEESSQGEEESKKEIEAVSLLRDEDD